MAFGFSQSTAELLLEIQGRYDAGSSFDRAIADMEKLAAAQKIANRVEGDSQTLQKAKLDLQKAINAQELRDLAMKGQLSDASAQLADRETRAYAAIRDGEQALAKRISDTAKYREELNKTVYEQRSFEDALRTFQNVDPVSKRYISRNAFSDMQEKQRQELISTSNELDKLVRTYEDRYGPTIRAFSLAHERGAADVERLKSAVESMGTTAERNGSKLDIFGQKVERLGSRFQRFGGPLWMRLFGNVIGGGLQGFGKLLQVGGPDARSLDNIAQGMGAVVAIGGGFMALMLAIPLAVGVATVAITALGDAIGTLVAVGVGLAAPLTLLTAFLAGPAVAVGYTISQLATSQSTYQTALTNLKSAQSAVHSAQTTYQNDLQSTSATATQTKGALDNLRASQDRLRQAQQAFADARQIHRLAAPLQPDIKAITSSLDSIALTAERRTLPFITLLAGQAKNFLSYLAQVVKLPLPQMFRSLATTGVDKLFRDLEQIGARVGPVIREALFAAFTYSGNLHNKLVILWNQLQNFFIGQHGALIPAIKWWDAQHFTQEGIGLFHTFMGFLERSGILNQLGGALAKIIADAVSTGFRLGFDLLKGEFGLLGQLIGAAVAGGIALSLAGAIGIGGGAGGALAGLIGMLSGGAGLGAAGIGLGGASLATAGLFAAPALGIGFGLLTEPTGPSAAQIESRRRGILGLPQIHPAATIPNNVLQQGFQSAALALAGVQQSALQITRIEQQMLAGMGIPRTSQVGQFALNLSRSAGRPLAPNEIALVQRAPAGVQPALQEFAKLTHLLPSQRVMHILVDHTRASQAIAALIGETHKLPTQKQMHILTNIPSYAIPAVTRLIEKVHGIPTRKELKVVIEGAKDAEQHLHQLEQRRAHLTQLMLHKDRFGAPDTTALDQKISDAQRKLQGFSGHTKSLFTLPVYQALGRSIPDGLRAGVIAGTPAAVAAVTSLVQQMHNAAKAGLHFPHSPSPLFIPLGESITQGISAGMLKAAGGVKQAMQQVLQGLQSQFSTFLSQFQGQIGALFTGPGGTGINPRTGFATRLATLQGFPGAKIPFGVVAGDLAQQVHAFRHFFNSLGRMRREGYPETLIQQIAAIGPSAQAEVDALLGASRGERHHYERLFREQVNLTNQAAKFSTALQLDEWRHMGRRIAFEILTGLQSVGPEIQRYLQRLAHGSHRHHRLGHHHAGRHVTNHITVNANPSESLSTTMRRTAFYYKRAMT